MVQRQDMLLKTGFVTLTIGCVLFFNPFSHEPLWAEWLVGPMLMYLGLPLAIVGTAIHFFKPTPSSTVPNPTKPHA